MHHSNLVAVRAFATQVEADLAKSLLDSAPIDSMIQSDRAGGMRDHLAWSGFGFRVLVREEDLTAARDVLDSAGQKPTDEVVVQEFNTDAEADSAVAALTSAGIWAETRVAAGISSTLGLERFSVHVGADDAAKAHEVLSRRSNPAFL